MEKTPNFAYFEESLALATLNKKFGQQNQENTRKKKKEKENYKQTYFLITSKPNKQNVNLSLWLGPFS